MKIKIITDSDELEQFTSREDITISKIDIRSCEQSSFAQQYFVAVIMYEENTGNNFDWQPFRAEAAKDILCAVLPKTKVIDDNFHQSIQKAIYNSVYVADMLIKQLKEKEEE